ncbi:hypothetical protein FDECE_4888 [Fusarium decemcellulare]|nr:hypothetical protein FDECE_4888 [Fusarium decemcellulare]
MALNRTGASWLKGTRLMAAITSVCSMAFLLFGYDQGVMSGVIISKDWLDEMGNPDSVSVGLITSIYDIGAMFGAIIAALTADSMGRKRALMFGTVLLIIGSVLMGAAMEQIMMYFGRIFTGLGIGYIVSIAPVYQSEVSEPQHRGWLLACHLSCLLVGLVLAYWINYAFYFYDSPIQWRFPLLFQITGCLYILVVTAWLPDTPRWLMFHESSQEQGISVLSRLRNKAVDDPAVQKEKDDILQAIEFESEAEGSWMDLLRDGGCQGNKRFFLAVGLLFMQQISGINIITYYAPTLFQTFLGMSQERALFIGGFLQVWYLCASFLTWWLIDAVGRRRLFIIMAAGMALALTAEAICVEQGGQAAGIAAVVFVFLFEGCFTWGWMAPAWVYPAEILPLKLRAKGNALAVAADFIGNFIVVLITPPAFDNIGWKIYVIFAVFNVVSSVICWLFYPETSGLRLESIDELFADRSSVARDLTSQAWYRKLQWGVISTSKVAVKKEKELRRLARKTAVGHIEFAAIGGLKSNQEEEVSGQHIEGK